LELTSWGACAGGWLFIYIRDLAAVPMVHFTDEARVNVQASASPDEHSDNQGKLKVGRDAVPQLGMHWDTSLTFQFCCLH
jgi:hypothetical protein